MVLDKTPYVFPVANVGASGTETQDKSVTITENGVTRVVPDSGKTLSGVTITVDVASATSEFPIVLNVNIPTASWSNNSLTINSESAAKMEKVTPSSDILLYPNSGSGDNFFDGGVAISSISNGEIVLSRTTDSGDLSIQIIILN